MRQCCDMNLSELVFSNSLSVDRNTSPRLISPHGRCVARLAPEEPREDALVREVEPHGYLLHCHLGGVNHLLGSVYYSLVNQSFG